MRSYPDEALQSKLWYASGFLPQLDPTGSRPALPTYLAQSPLSIRFLPAAEHTSVFPRFFSTVRYSYHHPFRPFFPFHQTSCTIYRIARRPNVLLPRISPMANPPMMNAMNPAMFQPQYPLYGIVQPAPAYRPLERCARNPSRAPPSHQVHSSTNREVYSRDLHLKIRQQPKEALVAVEGKEKGRSLPSIARTRATDGSLGRKPVDPPPFVQLMVNHSSDPASYVNSSTD